MQGREGAQVSCCGGWEGRGVSVIQVDQNRHSSLTDRQTDVPPHTERKSGLGGTFTPNTGM